MKWSSPLVIFVIASASIHLGLLMTMNSQKTSVILPGSAGSMLAVKVLPNKTRVITEKTVVKKQVPAPDKTTPHKLARKSNTLSSPETAVSKPQPRSQEENSIARSRVISLLVSELRQYFYYPRLAQKRNWQGKVVVTLHITPSGQIKDIMLARSSGYTVLDQAALSAVRKIRTFPDMAAWSGQDMQLELPVLYKLTEG